MDISCFLSFPKVRCVTWDLRCVSWPWMWITLIVILCSQMVDWLKCWSMPWNISCFPCSTCCRLTWDWKYTSDKDVQHAHKTTQMTHVRKLMYIHWIHIHSPVVGMSHKNRSWFSWEYSYVLIPTCCGHVFIVKCVFMLNDPKLHTHLFVDWGWAPVSPCGALSPYDNAACSQIAFGSALELISPFQIVTKDLDK